MYTIYVVFKCKDGCREKFVEQVKAQGILDEIKKEKGFIRYDYYFSDADPCELLLIEGWESKEDQQLHITQPHMARLREIKPEYVLSTTLGEFQLK
jgi:quinol monooxygenase YgiN